MSTEVKTITNAKERIYLYDNVKCLAIILVVIGHAINYLTDFDGYTLEKGMYVMIYSFHMPLFLFVSGLQADERGDEIPEIQDSRVCPYRSGASYDYSCCPHLHRTSARICDL